MASPPQQQPSLPSLPPLTTNPTTTTTAKKRKRKSTTTTAPTTVDSRLDSTLSPLIPTLSSALSSTLSFLNTHDLTLLPSHSLSLHASLTSASISLSKIQSFLKTTPTHIPISLLSPTSTSCCWFDRFLHLQNDDPIWLLTFRMSRPTFDHLTKTLSHSLSSLLPPSVDPRFALGAALYRLAHNGGFSVVGRMFGLSVKDCCRVFYAVCKVICDRLGGEDDGLRRLDEVVSGFERFSLPNCCGVLGVERFWLDGSGVLGKKGFLMVQALVDSNGRFLDVSAGWPSSFKPDLILQQTRLFLAVEESKELLNGLPFEICDGSLLPQYVLGDSCYPLLPWLVTPFLGRGEGGEGLSLEAREFNEVHRRAMGLASVAFARVRANWQLLNRRWKEKMVEFLPFIIMTGCVLNNFLLQCGEALPDGEPGCGEEQALPVYNGEENARAGRTRELLVSHLSRVCLTLTKCVWGPCKNLSNAPLDS